MSAEKHERPQGVEGGVPAKPPYPHPLSVHEEFDQLFNRFMEDLGPGSWMRFWNRHQGLGVRTWAPDIDVAEREGSLIIWVDLPGMKREDIELEARDKLLTIRGSRKQPEFDRQGFHRAERCFGEFARTIRLPEDVNTGAINAAYTDGVLEVTVPYTGAQKGKPVKVSVQ